MSLDVLDPFKVHYDGPVHLEIAELLNLLPNKRHGLRACFREVHLDVPATQGCIPGEHLLPGGISAALPRLSAAILSAIILSTKILPHGKTNLLYVIFSLKVRNDETDKAVTAFCDSMPPAHSHCIPF